MSEHSVIVWDLETIPDLAAARRLFDLGDAGDAQVREVLGSGFQAPASQDRVHRRTGCEPAARGLARRCVAAPHTGERSELRP